MDHPSAPPGPPSGPLSGITILDLTRVLAGPFATMVLGDLGARVIKVEPPDGDDSRAFGPWVGGTSAYFGSLNRGKESIALDLRDDADRAVFGKLAGVRTNSTWPASADVRLIPGASPASFTVLPAAAAT